MARNIEIICADDPANMAAERLAQAARDGGNIVVTGGGSVAAAYGFAAAMEPDWSKVDLWFTDERCVPAEDGMSNYRLVRESLLDRVTVHAAHRMRGELGRDEGAQLYEAELAAVERFDFILLGMG